MPTSPLSRSSPACLSLASKVHNPPMETLIPLIPNVSFGNGEKRFHWNRIPIRNCGYPNIKEPVIFADAIIIAET